MIDSEIIKEVLETDGFDYPDPYLKALELNLTNFDLWYFLSGELEVKRLRSMRKRYPMRKLIPFAKRDDCDDVACFEIGQGEKVLIVHDFASYGYEQRQIYNDFWDWVVDAVKEMVEYNRDL